MSHTKKEMEEMFLDCDLEDLPFGNKCFSSGGFIDPLGIATHEKAYDEMMASVGLHRPPIHIGFNGDQEIFGRAAYEKAYKEETEKKMMNKSMSVDDTLEQRRSVYGEFEVQLETVGGIVEIMKAAYMANNSRSPNKELLAEWHYLAIKLARVAVNPDHIDSYHDLAGYATLMERERMK